MPDTYNNLGILQQTKGAIGEAVDSYERAVTLKPESAEIHYNLANGLRDMSALEDAVMHYRKALAIRTEEC